MLDVNKRITAAIQLYKAVRFEDQHEVFLEPKKENRTLEGEIGKPLFERLGKRLVLTNAGQ